MSRRHEGAGFSAAHLVISLPGIGVADVVFA
jgi:hypothetical protein